MILLRNLDGNTEDADGRDDHGFLFALQIGLTLFKRNVPRRDAENAGKKIGA